MNRFAVGYLWGAVVGMAVVWLDIFSWSPIYWIASAIVITVAYRLIDKWLNKNSHIITP